MAVQKRVGFFFEESEQDQRDLLNSIKTNEAHHQENEIIRYLTSGIDAGVVMLVEHDYLKVPPEPIGEVTLQTDGEWIWPSSLAYYVREYHVSLPGEFIAKMEREDWRVSPDTVYTPEVPEGHIQM